MKYRKKPVVIEAFHFNDPDVFESEETVSLPKWLIDAIVNESICVDQENNYSIKTLEGLMRISAGDWIIKGVKGELYPCKPDIFKATYDLVE